MLDLDPYHFVALVILVPSIITIPITVFLMKLKTKTEDHDKCLKRLEESINSLRDEGKVDRQDVKIATKEDKVDLKMELQIIRQDISNVEAFLRENIPPLKRKGRQTKI